MPVVNYPKGYQKNNPTYKSYKKPKKKFNQGDENLYNENYVFY
jgi:hypothetical protein